MKIRIHSVRRIVQCLFFVIFSLIPFLNAKEVYMVTGNLLGINAFGIPLADPLSMTQAALGSLSITWEIIAGAGLSLLLAVALGTVFCSWMCPYGLLSELVHPLRNSNSANSSASPRPFIIRCVVVGLGLLAVILVVPFPLLNQLSLPGWITRFWQSVFIFKKILWVGFAAPALVLLAEVFAGKRLWCRYLCPQSVLISLAGLIAPQRLLVSFAPRQCTCPASDQVCRKSCSLGLNPRLCTFAQKSQCTNCGDCIDACHSRGQALAFHIGKGASVQRLLDIEKITQ